jgi:uncharacterized protein
MGAGLIGRVDEQAVLKKLLVSNQPEFLAIYGRRRIGKTFLVKQFYSQQACFFFSVTGIQNGNLFEQMQCFMLEIARKFYNNAELKEPENWFEIFDKLMNALETFTDKHQKIVLFFDEFPWMVTHRSKLLNVVEYFWNQYWSTNPRIKLIICGSSAAWIIRKIVNNKGGLHNRITCKIQLSPFNLGETKSFLVARGVKLNHKQITQLYMATGGVPYYLSPVTKGLSATQLIEELAFKKNSLLFEEFDNLFSSLFNDAEPYIELLRIIAQYRYGIGQEDMIRQSKNASRGGRIKEKLNELEDAGFIISFVPFCHKKRGIYYRLVDEYTLFYFKWIEPLKRTLQKQSLERGYWESQQNTPSWYSWSGYSFESLCYKHLSQIRKKLKMSPSAIAHTWRYVPNAQSKEQGAQIDLLFDRKDNTITLCEIKYTESAFVINKKYAAELLNKENVFIGKTKTKKQTLIVMIAAQNIKHNRYADDLITNVVTLDDLFI